MEAAPRIEFIAVPGFPLVGPGDDLAVLTLAGIARAGLELCSGDAVVFAQKIVSKAEGGWSISPPSRRPRRRPLLRQETRKDARLVELILRESRPRGARAVPAS